MIGLHIMQPHPVHEFSLYGSELTYSNGSSGAGLDNNLSPFATISVEERQATQDKITTERRQVIVIALAAREEHKHITRELEGAEMKDNTHQAQEKYPRSRDRSSATDPVQEYAKSPLQEFHQQSTYIEEGEPVTYHRALE